MASIAGGLIEMSFLVDNIRQVEKDIAIVLSISIDKAFRALIKDFQDIIINNLVFGGPGWKPIVKTAAWKWINSPQGYAELGFTSTVAPFRLLKVLQKSWTASVISKKAGASLTIGIKFDWANLEEIYRATIHSAAGKLNLPVGRSWFEWVYSGLPLREEGFKFEKTGPSPGVRSSAIAGAEAGRMTAGGFWQVSPRFRIDLNKLWEKNEKKISNTFENFISNFISKDMKRAR